MGMVVEIMTEVLKLLCREVAAFEPFDFFSQLVDLLLETRDCVDELLFLFVYHDGFSQS